MSSTFVADTTEDQKAENPLIIIVHNDGTVSVDHETLQNLIVNQQTRPVSLVRLGPPTQGDDSSQDSNGTCDSQNDGNPHVNLTVEGFYSPPETVQPCPTEGTGENLVDPFLEMDPEQLERLETALQSEQAKQILGENVTAMLDMLSVDEEAAQITDSIRMDHCYTNLSPSSAPLTSTPNHQYGPIGSSDTDNSDNSFETDAPPCEPMVTSSTTTFQQQQQQQQQPAPQPPPQTPPPQPQPQLQLQEAVVQLQKIQPPLSALTPRARGRGRGPGRPRREVSAVRTSSNRGASGRGRGSRTVRGGGNAGAKTAAQLAPGMVMVQQIKSINPPLAPPPSTPSTASLVPLIKPLVMAPGQHGTVTTTVGLGGVHKQVVTVPVSSGGTRMVTVSGGKLSQVLTAAVGQPRVLVTRPLLQQRSQPQNQPQLPPQPQTQPQPQPQPQLQQPVQVIQNPTVQTTMATSCSSPPPLAAKPTSSMPSTDVTSTEVVSSSHLPAQQDLVSSTVIPGMSVPLGQAKVLVAKMPTIPPQLLGAQPSSGLSEVFEGDKLQDNEVDFNRFPPNEESEDVGASDDDSDDDDDDDDAMDSDDEDYLEPGRRRGGRFGGKQRGGRACRRVVRGARTRGSGRNWDRGSNLRGGVTTVKRRGGRGRGGPGRPEEVERAQQLEAEMAAALVAMDKSPQKEENVIRSAPTESLIQEADSASVQQSQAEHSVPVVTKKAVTNTNEKLNAVKKKLSDALETKKAQERTVLPTSPTSPPGNINQTAANRQVVQNKLEKKSAIKSPIKKHSTDSLQPASQPVSQPTSSNISPNQEVPKTETRKNYPKRENRKPPAHLAEAFGPALFSTPDIIRRVSTGGEQKTTPPTPETPPVEMKKEESELVTSKQSPEMKINTTPVASPTSKEEPESLEEADPSLSDDLGSALQVPEDHGVLDTLHVEALKTEEELLADTILLQQHINDDVTPMETEVSEDVKADSVSGGEQSVSSTNDKEVVAKTASPPAPKSDSKISLPATSTATRSTRRRNSAPQDTVQKSPKQVTQRPQQSAAKERRKSDDSKGRGRARNKSRPMDTEVKTSINEEDEDDEDDDSDADSSDDESWNSEDDPDRLWCICKKPHNNRFMICCDSCEDWFHGKCVGVTKSMGQQMEEKGIEWCCPNCIKKKELEGKEKGRELKKQGKITKEKKPAARGTPIQHGVAKDLQKEASKVTPNATPEPAGQTASANKQSRSSGEDTVMKCIACQKEARPTSIYCSDACVLKHVQESLNAANKDKDKSALSAKTIPSSTTDSPAVGGKTQMQPAVSKPSDSGQAPKAKPDTRIMVYERKTGKLLAGPNAPTASNLKTWLKENPTYEVVRPGVQPTNKYYNQKAVLQAGKQQGNKNAAQPKVALIHKPAAPQTKAAPVQPKPTLVTVPTKQQSIPIAGKLQKLGTPGPLSINVTKDTTGINKSSVKGVGALKSPTGAPKTPIKIVSPGNTGNSVQPIKTAQTPVVSKAPATSTVKEAVINKTQTPTVTKKIEAKRTSSTSSVETPKKEEEKPAGPEPIRLNVRKTLQELLQTRIQECSDLSIPDEEVQKIALNIEEEMHSYFRDTGIKYKSKYRSLVFNIKDPKNLTLFRKIADKSLTPHQLVRLSPEELASQELAQWREREAKHQIEMIKKNELDLMTLSKTYVMKTHKGEQVIETDETMKADVPELVDPSAVPDIVSTINNSVSSTVEDTSLEQENIKIRERDKGKESKEKDDKKTDKERSSKEKEKSKRDDRKKDDKDRKGHSKESEGSRRRRHDSSSSRSERERKSHDRGKSSSKSKHHHHHHSDKDREKSRKEKHDEDSKKDDTKAKKDDDKINKIEHKVFAEAEIKKESTTVNELKPEPALEVKQEYDSDMSDREPSSTVIIKTPDINMDDTRSISISSMEDKQGAGAAVWKGFVNMPDVAKFFTTVQVVSGDPQNLSKDLPNTVDIVGRISPETVWDYIAKMKKSGTKEILVIRLIAANDEEKIPYITLYTYLNMRKRLGVVGNVSKMIKDFYIMPLASHNPVPQVLLPLDGPGFEDQRSYMLLGILVRARRKRLAPELTYVAKVPKRPPPTPAPITDLPERSYTPPLPGTVETTGSLTPPHPPPQADTSQGYTPPHSPKHSSYGPSSLDPRLSHKANMNADQEVVVKVEKEENDANSPPPSIQPTFDLPPPTEEEDDDAPYSPGGDMDEDNGESSEDNLLATPKNSSHLQRQMDELNRQIEEQKQQIESMSSAIATDTVAVGIETSNIEPTQVHDFISNVAEESKPIVPVAAEQSEDENEAYSPSRSFTPPAMDTIPFIGPSEETPTSVLSSLPSNISIPSNLGEILASIKKRETDAIPLTSNKGINLREDPIVQSYSESSVEADPSKMESDEMAYDPGSAVYVTDRDSPYPSNSPVPHTTASSVVPALLSLSTPVVHPHSTAPTKLEGKPLRDPRQKSNDTGKSSTLSSLSDDDLIKKAMEMELEAAATSLPNPALQQPLPPGVDNFPPHPLPTLLPSGTATSPPIKTMPSVQPLPPGLEDEEYPPYSSSFVPPPPGPVGVQTRSLPSASQAVAYSVRPSYHMPTHHYSPQGYMGGPPPPPPPQGGGNFNSSYVSGAAVMYSGDRNIMEDPGGIRNKRKYQDMEGDGLDMRAEMPKEVRGRETWDQKVPVPMRGRFNPRNLRRRDRFHPRGGGNPHRNFSRHRGGRNGPPHRSRWGVMGKNEDKSSRYDATIRSQWDSHIKDFEEKFRERTKHRDRDRDRERERERDRDRSSNNGRSYGGSSRSSKNRNSEGEEST